MVLRSTAIARRDQRHGHVVRLLDLLVPVVAQGFIVEQETAIEAARAGNVSGIAAQGDVTPRERPGLAGRLLGVVVKARDEAAVEATTAELQRLAVPGRRQVHLEADVRCTVVHRMDGTLHLAVFAVRVVGGVGQDQFGRLHGGARGGQSNRCSGQGLAGQACAGRLGSAVRSALGSAALGLD